MKFKITIAMIFIIFSNFTLVSYAGSNKEYNFKINTSYNNIFEQNYLENNYLSISQKENPNNLNLWIASIFIAGLGQILMGDYIKGFTFFSLTYLVPIAIFFILLGCEILFSTLINQKNISSQNTNIRSRGEGFGLAIIILIIDLFFSINTFIYFYIANVFDAYTMSRN